MQSGATPRQVSTKLPNRHPAARLGDAPEYSRPPIECGGRGIRVAYFLDSGTVSEVTSDVTGASRPPPDAAPPPCAALLFSETASAGTTPAIDPTARYDKALKQLKPLKRNLPVRQHAVLHA
ncbi:hypothetical protein [Burkholderia pseudomultivorans]|uniref:hypothetical protein n=1 Tax=Burkholderia pseudomultivorans TaxID=1207504 RepID=UPI0012D9241E|nr:hypothetical protein [Burkholderia pseudomultivorans]